MASAHSRGHPPVPSIMSDPPSAHPYLFAAGCHGNSHSALIGGRWPGVAANWAFRMEGGGRSCDIWFKEGMLLEATESIRDTRRQSDTRTRTSSYYINASLRTLWCGDRSHARRSMFYEWLPRILVIQICNGFCSQAGAVWNYCLMGAILYSFAISKSMRH